jgi:hypothetical protein
MTRCRDAAYGVIAGIQNVPGGVAQVIRDGRPIADHELQARYRFTLAVAKSRGWPVGSRHAARPGSCQRPTDENTLTWSSAHGGRANADTHVLDCRSAANPDRTRA